jgi:hypothetical protein
VDNRRGWRWSNRLWGWWRRKSFDLLLVHVGGFLCWWGVRECYSGSSRIRTFFVVLADFDDLVNVLLFEGSCDDDEVVLDLLAMSRDYISRMLTSSSNGYPSSITACFFTNRFGMRVLPFLPKVALEG